MRTKNGSRNLVCDKTQIVMECLCQTYHGVFANEIDGKLKIILRTLVFMKKKYWHLVLYMPANGVFTSPPTDAVFTIWPR